MNTWGNVSVCLCMCVVLENRAAKVIKANKVHGARGNGRMVNGITEVRLLSELQHTVLIPTLGFVFEKSCLFTLHFTLTPS